MSKPTLSLTLEARPGADIKAVCMELQQVASTLRIQTRCKVNDVNLYASPRGDWETLFAAHEREAAIRGKKFRAAHSWKE